MTQPFTLDAAPDRRDKIILASKVPRAGFRCPLMPLSACRLADTGAAQTSVTTESQGARRREPREVGPFSSPPSHSAPVEGSGWITLNCHDTEFASSLEQARISSPPRSRSSSLSQSPPRWCAKPCPPYRRPRKLGKSGTPASRASPCKASSCIQPPPPPSTAACCQWWITCWRIARPRSRRSSLLLLHHPERQPRPGAPSLPAPSPPPASQNVNLDQYLPRWKPRNLGIIQVSSPRAARRAGEGGGTVNPNGSGPSPLGDLVRAHGQVSSAGGVDGVSVLACGWG